MFYQSSLPVILNYLSNAPKNFFMEHNSHLIKKHLLEFVSRFPFNEMRNSLPTFFPLLYNLLEVRFFLSLFYVSFELTYCNSIE